MIPTYSYERALELANLINIYWIERGGDAGARPFIFREDKDEGPMWGVTSRLVNGWPVDRQRVAA